MNSVAIAVHLLAAVVWVGGMFFAYVVLRPALSSVDGPVRLTLWAAVFGRFFRWVWLSIVLLLGSGFFLVFSVYRGFAATPLYVHIMILLGFVMLALFVFLFFWPYREFGRAVEQRSWEVAGVSLNRIRRVVLTNLVLGIAVLLLAGGGRYFTIL